MCYVKFPKLWVFLLITQFSTYFKRYNLFTFSLTLYFFEFKRGYRGTLSGDSAACGAGENNDLPSWLTDWLARFTCLYNIIIHN